MIQNSGESFCHADGGLEQLLTVKLFSELIAETHYDITKMSLMSTTNVLPSWFVKMFQDDSEYFQKMQELENSKQLKMKDIGGKYNTVECQCKQIFIENCI